jgi:hypothetical protein
VENILKIPGNNEIPRHAVIGLSSILSSIPLQVTWNVSGEIQYPGLANQDSFLNDKHGWPHYALYYMMKGAFNWGVPV